MATANQDLPAHVVAYARSAVCDVLKNLGVTLTAVDTDTVGDGLADENLASIIGMHSGDHNGTLILIVRSELLAATNPAKTTDPSDLADWIGELSNLVIADFKQSILHHKVGLRITPPSTTVASPTIFERYQDRGPYTMLHFAVDGDSVITCMLTFEAEFLGKISADPVDQKGLPKRGDYITS